MKWCWWYHSLEAKNEWHEARSLASGHIHYKVLHLNVVIRDSFTLNQIARFFFFQSFSKFHFVVYMQGLDHALIKNVENDFLPRGSEEYFLIRTNQSMLHILVAPADKPIFFDFLHISDGVMKFKINDIFKTIVHTGKSENMNDGWNYTVAHWGLVNHFPTVFMIFSRPGKSIQVYICSLLNCLVEIQ